MMMILSPAERSLLQWGVVSRLFLFLLQLLCNFLPDHDADAFKPPPNVDDPLHGTPVDSFVRENLLAGFSKWDALHFLHVAEFGHVFEFDLAFFPGFPLALRWFESATLRPTLSGLLSVRSRLLMAATLLNNAFFLVSGVCLHRLGRRLFPHDNAENAIFLGVLWFYFNPASIFFGAAYSESLFFLAVVVGLDFFHQRRLLAASWVFAVAGAVRSNGVVFAGFFWFSFIDEGRNLLHSASSYRTKLLGFFFLVARTAALSAASWSLFIAFQMDAASLFCRRRSPLPPTLPRHLAPFAADADALVRGSFRARANASGVFLVEDDFPSWCDASPLPFSYSPVQNRYWHLGPFAYYRFKQIPNFLLAFPALVFSLRCASDYFGHHLRRPRSLALFFGLSEAMIDRLVGGTSDRSLDRSLLSIRLLPFHLYTIFLLLFGLCFMHVQVLTRLLLSSCPLLYFYGGSVLAGGHGPAGSGPGRKMEQGWGPTLLWIWAGGYFIVGAALHCNFLPWT